MNLDDARAVYERFRAYPGSQFIAKPGSISGVSTIIARYRPQAILEVGAGIGTVTHAIVTTLDAIGHRSRVVSIEHDAFCLAALARNLGGELGGVEVRQTVDGLEAAAFDLVIVDGGSLERGGYAELVARRGRIIVDGYREEQRNAIRQSGRRITIREVWPGRRGDGEYWLVQFEPNPLERAADRAKVL